MLLSRRPSTCGRQDHAAGGIKIGNESPKLALKLYDNQSDVKLSVCQYRQLVSQDKVDFLLGPFASNFALVDSTVSEKYKIPIVQGGGTFDEIFSGHFKYIFGTLASASNYCGSTVEMMKGFSPTPKSVALLYADDAFDVSVAEGTRPKLKQAGLIVAWDERYSTNATDFNSLLSQIRSADNVWARGRTHLPRSACVLSQLSYHQPGLCRRQYRVGAGGVIESGARVQAKLN